VLGSTELQGSTLNGLRSLSDSLKGQLSAASAQRDGYKQQANAGDTFLQTAEPKLLDGMLPGDRIVLVTEPGAPSAVIDGIQKAAGYAKATIAGTVALQPKFNDVSGATRSSLSAINSQLAANDGTVLSPGADQQTVYQQEAAQLMASAVLGKTADEPGLLSAAQAQAVLAAYAKSAYLTTSGTPWNRATLAVIVTPQAAPADGAGDPANQVLLALAGQFAEASAATLVAGPAASSASSSSAISVLRSSSVSGQVSSVDNADSRLGQISTIWALGDQLAGGKPSSYGISGASAVSPVPSPVPSETPTVSGTPTSKATGKVKKTVDHQ
jgi:hypothetical protein